jgi:preprotein translocase subunit YajC
MSFVPLILIFVVFYFLLIRPQMRQRKEHQHMLGQLRRGDRVVTGGGIVGKVTKVIDDNEVEVEIAKDVRVKIMRSMISNVMVKGAPVAANDTSGKKSPAKKK